MRHPLVLAVAVVAIFLGATGLAVTHPGYTDAYYYFLAARRLGSGDGLSIDFVWNFLEAPGFAPLPIASHRFWMPLATALQAGGIAALGPWLGAFRAAQLAVWLVALLIPLVTYLAARKLGAPARLAALAALVAGLGGAYAPAWPSLDNFAPVAILATLFFAMLDGVARGQARSALIAGAALGGLVLARADGAVYAAALIATLRASPSRSLLVLATAAAVGAPWYARDAALGFPEGQLARTALLVRYEDFFRLAAPDLATYLAAWPEALAAKLSALAVNALTFVLGMFVVLGPLALFAAWRRRAQPIAAGWLAATLVLYLAQSLVFTQHSTRGSFAHSAAGLLPLAVALALVEGAGRVRVRGVGPAVAAAAVAISALAVLAWHDAFDPPYEARRALAVSGVVVAPALVADAAAWRFVLDGPAFVMPADGPAAAREVARRYGARSLVLERSHFSAYDGLAVTEWLERVPATGEVQVFRIRAP